MSRPYDDPYQAPNHNYPAASEYPQQLYPERQSQAYYANPSTEKIIDEFPQNTERERKGRAGLHQIHSMAGAGPPPRSTGILRMWRKDERGKQWSRGGGVRTFFRLCCCCTTLSVIVIASVLLAIALYVRPPNLRLNNINLGSSGVNLDKGSFTVNINLGISVSNPNWFNVDFKEISADVQYPGTTGKFGGGTLYNINFAGHTESTFDFPLALNYSSAIDPNRIIVDDLVTKCGVSGGSRSDVVVDYVLYLKLRILSFIIPFQVSSDATFACPISASDIQKIAGSG